MWPAMAISSGCEDKRNQCLMIFWGCQVRSAVAFTRFSESQLVEHKA